MYNVSGSQPHYYSAGSFSQNSSPQNREVIVIPSSQNQAVPVPPGVPPAVAVSPVPLEPDVTHPRQPGLGRGHVLRISDDSDDCEVPS